MAPAAPTVAELAKTVSSVTHPAEYAAMKRFAENAKAYPELAAAVQAGGTRMKEALAKIILTRQELLSSGRPLREAGTLVESQVVKETQKKQELSVDAEFWYEDAILKDLNYDQKEMDRILKQREKQGEGVGYIKCPNRGVKKFWWSTRQSTKAPFCSMVCMRLVNF